ncbi:cobalt-precorrin-6A reductase [Pseudoxanthobacter sp.]|uniref:cobalt-precorrin-6A reductase n=1 Tax=Pseudoxanthobacter sp. TaxID=1925742 RepID=UPI002FDFFC19
MITSPLPATETAAPRGPAPRLLILGGTGEARLLAAELAARGEVAFVLSLAGRTRAPLPQAGTVRTGGFGGAAGLTAYLRAQGIAAVIDATHPFAARISASAHAACAATGLPLLALRRPPWQRRAGDDWTEVASVAAAAEALRQAAPQTVFLAIGRQEAGAFLAAPQHRYVVRSIDPVAPADLPAGAVTILDRGPFTEAGERALFLRHGIEVLVTKNAGGSATQAKTHAARALRLPVLMVSRPAVPDCPVAGDVAAAHAAIGQWLAAGVLRVHDTSPPTDRGE